MNIERIIQSSEGLIKKIASKFYGVDYEDLYQAGVLGLLKAYKNYINDHNTKFSTYAYEYIYGEMYSFINNKMVKINKDITKLYKLIDKTKVMLTQKYNHEITNLEVAKFLNIDPKIVDEATIAYCQIASLDSQDNVSLYDTLKKEESINIDDKILINDSMNQLTKDEKTIIKARYYDDLTQSEIAKKLNMTQVMVSRYEKKGLTKMHKYMTL